MSSEQSTKDSLSEQCLPWLAQVQRDLKLVQFRLIQHDVTMDQLQVTIDDLAAQAKQEQRNHYCS